MSQAGSMHGPPPLLLLALLDAAEDDELAAELEDDALLLEATEDEAPLPALLAAEEVAVLGPLRIDPPSPLPWLEVTPLAPPVPPCSGPIPEDESAHAV